MWLRRVHPSIRTTFREGGAGSLKEFDDSGEGAHCRQRGSTRRGVGTLKEARPRGGGGSRLPRATRRSLGKPPGSNGAVRSSAVACDLVAFGF